MNTRLSAPPLTARELITALQNLDPDAIPAFTFPDGQRYVTGVAESGELQTTAGVIEN